MCKITVRKIILIVGIICVVANLWGEDLEQSFSLRLSPGSFTVEEAVAGGGIFVPSKTPGDYDYVILGPFNMLAKNGIVESFLFLGSKEEYPPSGIIGFKIEPSFSPYDLIEKLVKAEFSCEYISLPTIKGEKIDSEPMQYKSSWTLFAFKESLPELLFKFVFSQAGSWSYSRGFCLDTTWIQNINTRNSQNARPVSPSQFPLFATEKEWALDLTMPLSVMNSTSYSTLMPIRENQNLPNEDYWKGFLEETWSITSREEYFSMFDDVCSSGQSNSYTELLALLQKNQNFTPLQIALHLNMEKYQCDRMYFVEATKDWLGERSLRAWDLGRMIIVTRWAYGAGYISEEEAWEQILPIAKTLRTLYHSREDYLSSYIGGRGFFGSSDPWDYMKSVLESTLKEYQKIESRQHLLWEIPGEIIERSETKLAAITDITYTMSDEQNVAQRLFNTIETSINEYQKAVEDNNLQEMLGSLSHLREILSPYAINLIFPPLYYQAYFSEGLLWIGNQEYEKALKAFKEVETVSPNDEKVQDLILRCTEELQVRQNEP